MRILNLSGKHKMEREIQPCNGEVCLSELFYIVLWGDYPLFDYPDYDQCDKV